MYVGVVRMRHPKERSQIAGVLTAISALGFLDVSNVQRMQQVCTFHLNQQTFK